MINRTKRDYQIKHTELFGEDVHRIQSNHQFRSLAKRCQGELADRFIPERIITIRENGRVVGQSQLNNLCQGEIQDLNVGNDPDVSFDRQVKILSQQRQSASYLIHLTISNSKSKSIKYQYKEMISSAKFTFIHKNQDEQLDHFVQFNSQDFTITNNDLEPNQQQIFAFEIALEYKDNYQQC